MERYRWVDEGGERRDIVNDDRCKPLGSFPVGLPPGWEIDTSDQPKAGTVTFQQATYTDKDL